MEKSNVYLNDKNENSPKKSIYKKLTIDINLINNLQNSDDLYNINTYIMKPKYTNQLRAFFDQFSEK